MSHRCRWVVLNVCFGLVWPASAAAQAVAVPSTDIEWQELSARLERNPLLLAAAGPDAAVPVVVAALRTRPDGLFWAAYGPGICTVKGSERRRLAGAARVQAYQSSRDCLEAILSELPPPLAAPDARIVRSMFLRPLAESMIEVGDLVAADTLASAALANLADLDPRARGNPEYDMNEIRGRVALRHGDREAAVEFLRRAGRTHGSPQLSSFGPRFVLARELLEVGERAAVLDFLDAVALFWHGADAEAALADARREIEAGRIPDDVRWR